MEANALDRLLDFIQPRVQTRWPRSPSINDVRCLVLNACPTPSKVAQAMIAQQWGETVCIYQVEALGRVHCHFFGHRAIDLAHAFAQDGTNGHLDASVTLPHLSIFEQLWMHDAEDEENI
mmetsp:Transcript_52731/g.123324  ORF Transcript_52731/g.123324 Transcript_52731/m.123324 type:complete len:120 (-) Transcript_52731:140-499(-)